MKIDIMTLFPEAVDAMLHESILGRAVKKGILEINSIQIRDFTENKQMQVDDYPYGGGWGCIMMAQPLKSCLDHLSAAAPEGERRRVIYMSPQGKPFTQSEARRLRDDYDHLILVCGHYEGIDERFIVSCVDEEISLGDFVLTGGEIAAMAVTDAVCRLVPGVLSDAECYTGESHWDGLLEYPQYTRPEVWEGQSVPKALLTGNHADVERWRRREQLRRTRDKRPDMFAAFVPQDKQDAELLRELEKEKSRTPLTSPVECRKAVPEDVPAIMEIVMQAKRLLKSRRIDQWQDAGYPAAETFLSDIAQDQCFVLLHEGVPGAFFVLSMQHESGYDDITDGKWGSDAPYAVIHRCAVAEQFRGMGMADLIFENAERLTLEAGRSWLRVDTHKHNKSMQAALRRHGFHYRGNVLVSVAEGHDPRRLAFEKKIKTGK